MQIENEGQEAALEASKWRDTCKRLKKVLFLSYFYF